MDKGTHNGQSGLDLRLQSRNRSKAAVIMRRNKKEAEVCTSASQLATHGLLSIKNIWGADVMLFV